MSVNFKEIENKEPELTIIKFQDKDINVRKTLTTDEKYDIVMISLQQAKEENAYYNPILLDMFFNLNLVYTYTDIIFDEEDRMEPSKVYDALKNSGFMDALFNVIDENDYQEMFDAIDEIKYQKNKYNASFASVANKFIDDLPANAKAALDIVDNFDENKFGAAQAFAKALNGGREITK